jgi:uncharacterized damage-inducible protein DinB
MNFTIDKSIEILERTPFVVQELLQGISDDWSNANEGENTFSTYDVIGHLIHGEKTDWIARMEIILSDNPNKVFQPYDRFAQFEESKGKNLSQLLQEFKTLREKNMELLKSKNLSATDLEKTATHPALGTVTLRQLLSTWTVHDLNHIGQIVRVMSKHYKDEVGPWQNYLPILTR